MSFGLSLGLEPGKEAVQSGDVPDLAAAAHGGGDAVISLQAPGRLTGVPERLAGILTHAGSNRCSEA